MNEPPEEPSIQADDGLTDGIAEAASEVETAIRRYEEMVNAACKVRLSSEKNLARAARALGDAATSQERISESIGTLSRAIVAAQGRQQTANDRMAACALALQAKTVRFGEMMLELTSIGERSASINGLLEKVAPRDGVTVEPEVYLRELEAVKERLTEVIDRAKELERVALHEELRDVAKHADSLRQQLQSVRGKVASYTHARAN